MLPAQNSSGNWVKVVQRMPVRIRSSARPGRAAAARRHERGGRDRHRPRPPSRRPVCRDAAMAGDSRLPDRRCRTAALITVCAMIGDADAGARHHHRQRGAAVHAGQPVGDPDQITWVLTSYIIAAAIMTAPVGWLAARFGRKRLFLLRSVGFTVASMLCGMAQPRCRRWWSFRLLQGVFGAALVPLSQAHDARHLSARAARLGDGDLGHGRDGRADPRADARRLSDRRLQLALGVLHQPAVRHPRRHRPVAVHAEDADASRAALRLDRLRRARASASARCS